MEPLLVVRARRRPTDVLLGYLLPVALCLAAAITAGGVALGIADDAPLRGAAAGLLLGFMTAIIMIVPGYAVAGARATRQGADRTAGLPLAALDDDGVRVRYRAPTLRERRRGTPDDPAYDVEAPWTAITGCRDGVDPHGQPVILLEVTDRETVIRRQADPLTARYITALETAEGTPLAIRAPIAGPRQLAAVRARLASHGIG